MVQLNLQYMELHALLIISIMGLIVMVASRAINFETDC